jgi:hypothetical protein
MIILYMYKAFYEKQYNFNIYIIFIYITTIIKAKYKKAKYNFYNTYVTNNILYVNIYIR